DKGQHVASEHDPQLHPAVHTAPPHALHRGGRQEVTDTIMGCDRSALERKCGTQGLYSVPVIAISLPRLTSRINALARFGRVGRLKARGRGSVTGVPEGVESRGARMRARISRRTKPMAQTPAADVHPPYLYPDYKSTRLRAPAQSLVRVGPSPVEATGPAFPGQFVKESEADLTTWGRSAPLGEKMVLVGRVLDEDGRPVRRSLVEVWQANASGRYPYPVDDHDAPLDPNFLGKGQVLTDDDGRYRIVTVKPGAYPWQNHAFGWRPAHIHFSLFGNAFAQRLITQM